ncbi:MAG: Yip1 family protein, partial [Nannocystaceae bacterium]
MMGPSTTAPPRAYDCGYLPLEDPRRHDVRRWSDSLSLLVRRPFARSLTIREPVGHASVIRLMWAVRWPTWLLCSVPVFLAFVGSVIGDPPAADIGATGSWVDGLRAWCDDQIVAPSLLDEMMPSFFVRSLRVWLLLMVPLGIPLVYFLAGITAHVVLVLTGGAPRSMGTTMRAIGLAVVPVSLVYGVMDVLATYGWISPTVWLWAFVPWTVWLATRLFAGVRCLHGLKKRRALSVLPPTLLILTA